VKGDKQIVDPLSINSSRLVEFKTVKRYSLMVGLRFVVRCVDSRSEGVQEASLLVCWVRNANSWAKAALEEVGRR